MTHRQVYWALLLMVAIGALGCQTAPRNPSEVIGQGYAELTTAAHDVAYAHTSGLLSDTQTAQLKAQLQSAKNSLDLASQAYVGTTTVPPDLPAAQRYASQAHIALQIVIAALKAKGVKGE